MRRDLGLTLSAKKFHRGFHEVTQRPNYSHTRLRVYSLNQRKTSEQRLVCNGCCQNIILACVGEFTANREGVLLTKQTFFCGKLTVNLTGIASSRTQLQEFKPKKVSVGRLMIQI
jgi:hypothetical protein